MRNTTIALFDKAIVGRWFSWHKLLPTSLVVQAEQSLRWTLLQKYCQGSAIERFMV